MKTYKQLINEAKRKKDFDVIGHLKSQGYSDAEMRGDTIHVKRSFIDHVKEILSNLFKSGKIKKQYDVQGKDYWHDRYND